jgi:hypothetical protein
MKCHVAKDGPVGIRRYSQSSTRITPNQSFERTRTGILQLGLISFLPNRSLPLRAAQLQR